MAQNIEIKARANDFETQYQLAQKLSDTPLSVLEQSDTFFNVPKGRLKLREFPDQAAQLIFYHRNNVSGPKLSDYHICETQDPVGLKTILNKAYGQAIVVNKNRHLFFKGRTRIHFDTVENLGHFIELEVVLVEGEEPKHAQQEANELMQALGIAEQDLVQGAYADLLANDQRQTNA